MLVFLFLYLLWFDNLFLFLYLLWFDHPKLDI